MRRISRLAPLWIALGSLLISALLATVAPLPQPQFHDEFSYLLAGDTFARGRLTNRPHELWTFFESFQILQQPTYMSKYPPGQGLVLALGQVLGGEPIVGVWLSAAAAGAALWWALVGLVPRRWATLGAVVAVLHPLALRWSWSYWGGSVALLAGALVVGAVARWKRRRANARTGLALGIGLFMLMITRPFEGLILAMLSPLLPGAPARTCSASGGQKGALVAAAITLFTGFTWMGYYNWRVTANPLRLPYAVYEQTYAACPPFLWWPDGDEEKPYRHESMRRYYLEWELPQYRQQRHQPIGKKLWDFARAYLGSPVLVIAVLAALLWMRRGRLGMRPILMATAFTAIAFGNLWFFPHYAAPAVAVYLLVVVQGLRHLRARRGGRWIVSGVLVLHVSAAAVWAVGLARAPQGWNDARAALIEQARGERRKLLIFVRPAADSYTHNELVYNEAEIDASAIVWARDMGPEGNRALIGYFRDREVWLLREGHPLVPYP